MTAMIAEVYDALKSAGAGEDKARAAAEAVATHQRETTDLREDMRTGFADVRGELKLVKWMLGFNLALSVAIVIILFRMLAA